MDFRKTNVHIDIINNWFLPTTLCEYQNILQLLLRNFEMQKFYIIFSSQK